MLETTEAIIIAALVALAAFAVIALMARRAARHRHEHLKRRFGPEYDRAVASHGSEEAAERELAAREKRVRKLELKALSEADRVQYERDWNALQARFVDDPSGAVDAAHELIKVVMVARGYEIERFDRRVADLSVEHAHVLEHYRSAREVAVANREGRADTEDLRQAFVHYRALFADLLEPHLDPRKPSLQHEVRA